MEIFYQLVDFFGLGSLSVDATFIDLLQYVFSVGCAVFIVCFIIRTFFMICELPSLFKW